ncbi:HAD family phosphatase [Facklamia sp. DSM 111018]|uniref:HAD family phosphatase n=1 Tax=Facklamia lactis TaxID=2749967 RepID=A0ABS0LPU9_9LACT|nr:HAD family phosphatase [Facklamia lactis]MBG9980383.1 HAD family phosphatase [Facklamia lactis]MBG9986186.1 HAD family phosphatase [Facklamia lactis]
MKKLDTVIFDMDGLMFDTEIISYQANQRAANELDMEYNLEMFKKNIGMNGEEELRYIHQLFPNHPSVEKFIELSQHYQHEAIAQPENIIPKKGLFELLNFLKDKNINLIIASSSFANKIVRYTKIFEIESYFTAYVAGNQVKRTKPFPDIFEKAYKLSQASSKDSVIVLEDSKNGVVAANKAGLKTIIVPDLIEPDLEMKEMALAVLEDLFQVKDYLKTNFI